MNEGVSRISYTGLLSWEYSQNILSPADKAIKPGMAFDTMTMFHTLIHFYLRKHTSENSTKGRSRSQKFSQRNKQLFLINFSLSGQIVSCVSFHSSITRTGFVISAVQLKQKQKTKKKKTKKKTKQTKKSDHRFI